MYVPPGRRVLPALRAVLGNGSTLYVSGMADGDHYFFILDQIFNADISFAQINGGATFITITGFDIFGFTLNNAALQHFVSQNSL
ncbi:MAG: hypothetical protein R2778_04600 [Saprospiraceae bacterium]